MSVHHMVAANDLRGTESKPRTSEGPDIGENKRFRRKRWKSIHGHALGWTMVLKSTKDELVNKSQSCNHIHLPYA